MKVASSKCREAEVDSANSVIIYTTVYVFQSATQKKGGGRKLGRDLYSPTNESES